MLARPITRLSLEEIKKKVNDKEFHHLLRSQHVTDLYEAYKKVVLKEWISIEDHVNTRFLGASTRVFFDGRKYSFFSDYALRYCLSKNEFPYHVEEDISHLLLWATESLSSPVVNKILKEELQNRYHESFWFEQPINLKSVKGVWHAHVFVRHL